MTALELLAFLALAGLAAYVQTVTGFAFGLVTMGGVGLTGLMPLPDAAVIVSVLTLVNAVQVLAKGWRDVAGRELGLVMAASLPLLLAGYALLQWLAEGRLDLLRLALGLAIVVSSLQLLRRPAPLETESGMGSFLFFGGLAGMMGGLFSTAGPPLVYHFYRQPLPLVQIRETLVSVFAINAVLRLAAVAATGHLPPPAQWTALLAVPAVMASTYVARRWPPPLAPSILRRIVFVLLFLSGLSLAGPVLNSFLGDIR